MPRNNDSLVITLRIYQIVLGSLLGDGSLNIYPPYKNARFQEKHGEKQMAYMEWKVLTFGELCSPNAISAYVDYSSYAPTRIFHTRACKCFTVVHKEVNHQVEEVQPDGTVILKNKRNLKGNWLNKVGPLGLAVWWMDDGGLIGAGPRRGRLNTQGFGYDGCVLLQKFLMAKWHVPTTIQICWARGVEPIKQAFADPVFEQTADQDNGESAVNCKNDPSVCRPGYNKYFYLQFSTSALKAFLRVIMPEIPLESMVYKTFLVYTSRPEQQLWIDEMKNLMPAKFHAEIDRLDRLYTNRRNA